MYLKVIETKYFAVSSNINYSLNFIDWKNNLSLKTMVFPST